MLAVVAVALGLVGYAFGGAAADTIRLRADDWCPYNCQPDSDRPGYMIDIAREVFGAAGLRVDYATLNWQRSIEEARRGLFEGIVGTITEEAPDFVFPSVPLGRNRDGYAMRRGATFADDLETIAGLVVGGIRGYKYSGAVGEFIERHLNEPDRVQLLAGDNALAQNLRKLAAGRVDLVVDDVNRLHMTIAGLGLEDEIEIVHEDEPSDVFIAFSPANPRSTHYAELLSSGVEALRASGRLAAILARYGLQDWH